MKVLIIEDNQELTRNIRDFLAREGYICESCETVQEAKEKLSLFKYDCILLDIGLPDGSGIGLLNLIRADHKESNVLIISAKNALDDKIIGLEKGADDYITKPFHLAELHARIRAVYRRKNLGGASIVEFNEISLNTDTFEARINDALLDMTPKEFDLLLYFLVNKNRVLSRQAIAAHLWGDYTDNLANFDFVYQHVKNLRRKISNAGGWTISAPYTGWGISLIRTNRNETNHKIYALVFRHHADRASHRGCDRLL
ncbi:response regulator transcription factor [Puia sp. P3]|uniref:response regulator transcription factor n=1 Tax=Puia sp. P3 TaxID=3423952 RepID=UPI003D669901